MIIGFKHKGLKLFYEKGNGTKLNPQHLAKIRLILTRLDAATLPIMLDQPGYAFHGLTGDRKGEYAVKINGNWRITFRFEGENATDVDYVDYH